VKPSLAKQYEALYSASPIDWDAITKHTAEQYLYDPHNAVTLSADVVMILLRCRERVMLIDQDHL
jgi:hypothetical protein